MIGPLTGNFTRAENDVTITAVVTGDQLSSDVFLFGGVTDGEW